MRRLVSRFILECQGVKGDETMSDELRSLIEKTRHYQMTPEELMEQAISFAYGNGHFEDERVTREGVARAASALTTNHDVRSARQ